MDLPLLILSVPLSGSSTLRDKKRGKGVLCDQTYKFCFEPKYKVSGEHICALLTNHDVFAYHQALRKTSRAVRYFPSIRAVVNQMVRNMQRRAVLSTSSTDTALSGDGSGLLCFIRNTLNCACTWLCCSRKQSYFFHGGFLV